MNIEYRETKDFYFKLKRDLFHLKYKFKRKTKI